VTHTASLLTALGTLGVVGSVLYGLALFRVGLSWIGVALGGLWGWTLGAMLIGGHAGALGGAVLGAAVLGTLAGSAERAVAVLLGGIGFWVLGLGAGSAAGLGGHPLGFVGLAGALVGGALVIWLHDFVVAIAVAVWGTAFLRLGELAGGGSFAALPGDAWLDAPELVVAGQFGQVLQDGPLRALVLAGFVGVAWMLQRLDAQEARGRLGKLGIARLRRLGWLCAGLSLLPLLAPALAAFGGDRHAPWLHVPRDSLGLEAATWPAATAWVWVLAGWAKRSSLAVRAAASLLAGLGLLGFGVVAQHVSAGVPLAPLLEDALAPSGPLDPDVLGAAAFALLMFVGPLGPRRTRPA
jgi:hypothetical protein